MMVGDRVRQIRRAQGRTVTGLAASSRLSRSFVTRVEAGDGNPSLDSLEKLASALGVPVTQLLSEGAAAVATTDGGVPPSGRIEIMRRHRPEGRRWETDEHVKVGFLRPGSQPAMEIALEAGTSQEGQPIRLETHGGDEFGIVLDGRYELITTGARQILNEGDSVRISGAVAHQVRPIGEHPSRILWVVSPPDGVFDGDVSRVDADEAS